jgi:hypothetical protein
MLRIRIRVERRWYIILRRVFGPPPDIMEKVELILGADTRRQWSIFV